MKLPLAEQSFGVVFGTKMIGRIVICHDRSPINPESTALWAIELYVEPEWRRLGIARTLLAMAEQHAKNCGFNVLFLDTLNAARYYKELGWKRLKNGALYNGKITVVFMKKL